MTKNKKQTRAEPGDFDLGAGTLPLNQRENHWLRETRAIFGLAHAYTYKPPHYTEHVTHTIIKEMQLNTDM